MDGACRVEGRVRPVSRRAVVIEIPAVPTRASSPNGRAPWRAKAAAVKALRTAAKLAAIDALNTPGTGAPEWRGTTDGVVIDVHYVWPANRKRMDDDNAKACAKPLIDGLSDALWDGQDAHVTLGTVRQSWATAGWTGTLATLTDEMDEERAPGGAGAWDAR